MRASLASGRPGQLSAAQQAKIQAVLDEDPRGHGFDTSGWIIPRVRRVIGVTSGVWLDRGHLSRRLRRWGLSYQRPALRAVERNEAAMATWVRDQTVVLNKKDRHGGDSGVRR